MPTATTATTHMHATAATGMAAATTNMCATAAPSMAAATNMGATATTTNLDATATTPGAASASTSTDTYASGGAVCLARLWQRDGDDDETKRKH
jgi:hypothetical protein